MTMPPERIVKGYELREMVGAGGFGAVYRAYQIVVAREVAIKVILPQRANQPEFIRRFEIEAQTIARLEHPHIVPLYDYWREPDGAYLVMRWLPNTLRMSLHRGAWKLEAAARLVDQLAAALTVAHREGIVHRDIKPENILLDEDENGYLADFGIAKDIHLRDAVNQTNPDEMVGSPAYLSPEQIRSQVVSARSDLYSLGYVLYELLTGHKPHPDAMTPSDYIQKHLTTPLPMISIEQSHVPAAIDEVLQTATAKDPANRYASLQRFSAAFRAAVPTLLPRIPEQPLANALTQRELEVLQLMVNGLTNQQITDNLFLSPVTVKWYARQIYRKLDVHSRQQAVERALNLKLLERYPKHSAVDAQAEMPTVIGLESQPALLDTDNPYKGLRAFQEADADDFFGRAALTERLLSRLSERGDEARFLVIIGPSGSGKSSLVRAGLLPALRNGALTASPHPFLADMLPGTDPLNELEAALLRVSINALPGLMEQLREDRRGLVRAARRVLPNDADTELILVVDQFEELFTLVEDEVLRAHFIDNLLSAATDPRGRIRVIITLRADFYDKPLLYPRLAELVRVSTEVIVPLSARELEQAIIGPAERVGLRFETGLVSTILKDVSEQPGTLPLLQYALTELFEQREGVTLTLAAYNGMGGVLGALARRAEELYQNLDDPSQALTRQMFLRLVTLGEGTEDTRRRTPLAELNALGDEGAMDDLLNAFAGYRLLTLDHNPATRSPTVELAHEAILRSWERLRGWLNESRTEIRIQRQLAAMAKDWQAAGQDASFLAHGARLDQFEKWRADTRLALTQVEHDYLHESIAERERQERLEQTRQSRERHLEKRSQYFLRGLVAIFALAALIALGLTAVALNERNTAQNNARLASARELAAAAVTNLGIDPQRSLLLALQAVNSTYERDGTWTREAEEALHRAAGTAQAQTVLRGHEAAVFDVAYSPDGTRLATASLDGTTRVWDITTHETLLRLVQSEGVAALSDEPIDIEAVIGDVYSVAYSPDGSRIATGSASGTVIVWDALTGESQLILRPQQADYLVTNVAFNDDGTQLALIAADLTLGAHTWEITVWDITRGEPAFSIPAIVDNPTWPMGTVWGDVAFSPNGDLLAFATSEEIRIFNLAEERELLTLIGHTSVIIQIAFSPDGNFLATASDDGTAKVWDISLALDFGASTARELYTLPGHEGVAFSPDGNFLATTSDDGEVEVWDTATGQARYILSGHTGSVRRVAFSPDGQHLATAGNDMTARLWEAAPGAELFAISGTRGDAFYSYSPDGTRLATIDNAGRISVWDASNGDKQLFIDFETHATTVVFSPDGSRLATSGPVVHIWDAITGEDLLAFGEEHGGSDQIAFSPDGTRIATSASDGSATLWDASSGAELFSLAGAHVGSIHCLAFSPDGRYLATGGDDKKVVVWDLESQQSIFELPTQGNVVTEIAYSPDGTRIATATVDSSAEVWDALSGELLLNLSGQAGAIYGVRFSPDGRQLVTSGGTAAILRDALTGEELLALYGHTSTTIYSAFSPDGTRLATSGNDETLLVYVLPMTDLLALAESRLTRSWTVDECRRYLHLDACPTEV